MSNATGKRQYHRDSVLVPNALHAFHKRKVCKKSLLMSSTHCSPWTRIKTGRHDSRHKAMHNLLLTSNRGSMCLGSLPPEICSGLFASQESLNKKGSSLCSHYKITSRYNLNVGPNSGLIHKQKHLSMMLFLTETGWFAGDSNYVLCLYNVALPGPCSALIQSWL